METINEVEGWSGSTRRDGVKIGRTLEGSFIAIPPMPGPVATVCPCCRKPMWSEQAAKHVANRVFPLSPEA